MPEHAANETGTFMLREAAEAPAAVERQHASPHAFRRLGERLRTLRPSLVITCARGSSDHAATYAKYLIESRAYAVCASAAPSISSVYASPLPAAGALCLAISQSGRSPDILQSAKNLKESGALVIALVNDEASPLAGIAHEVLPLCAGPERSVAATKSYIAALAAIARLVAHWTEDEELLDALVRLPARLEQAFALNWRLDELGAARSLFVLARGLGFGIAQEAALKLKETSRIHAEAYSAAEVLHGPAALVGRGFPVLAFAQDDETLTGMKDVLARLVGRGATVIAAGVSAPGAASLASIEEHPVLQPVLTIQSFYRAANRLSLQRGLNPDEPPNLSKITETV